MIYARLLSRCAAAPAAALALSALPIQAADPDPAAGALLAVDCAACHGSAGVSTGEDYPNLAAQKAGYIASQLAAFRSGERTNTLMNAVAASLSDADIQNLAAHFASLSGADPGVVAANETGLDGSTLAFPAEYESTFKRYHRIDFEDRKQVRFYSANEAALQAAGTEQPLGDGAYLLVEIFGAEADPEGNLVKDADGALVPTERKAFTAMELRQSQGAAVPGVLRNGDWRYAVFSAAGEPRSGLNEAPCLACHKPEAAIEYVFTLDQLRSFASRQ